MSLDDIPILAWVLFLVGVFVLAIGLTRWERAGKLRRWSHARGVVSSSRKVKKETDGFDHGDGTPSAPGFIWVPEVRFDFTVDGREYRGRHPEEDDAGDNFAVYADGVLAAYPVGREVEVAYNPARPGESMLAEPSRGRGGPLLTTLGVALMIGGLAWGWFALH
jgi:hypothetical protein